MTHEQIVRRVARREGISMRDARRVAGAYMSELAGALARGEAAVLSGVGTLTPPRQVGGRTTFRATTAVGPMTHQRDEDAPADPVCEDAGEC